MSTELTRAFDRIILGDARRLLVHDFTRVDLPFDAVVGAFVHEIEANLLARLLTDAWTRESDEVHAAIAEHRVPAPGELTVRLGQPRARREALIVPIVWHDSDSSIPPLEADLEVVAFGPRRTHLHIVGLSQLSPGTPVGSDRASVENRLTVAVIRHVLCALADHIQLRSTGGEDQSSA